MTTGRYRRGNATLRQVADRRSQRENNFFLAIIGLSLLVHTIVAALFLYTPTTTSKRRPPALYVDLVMAPPVANPQRGSASATVKTVVPAATIPQPTVAPTKVVKAPVVVKEKETKKTAVVKDDVDIAADIAKMKQDKKEQDELKEALAAIAVMKKKTTPAPPAAAAAVGSASGTGDEAGSAIDEWLQRAVKEKWTWTDRKKKDLSAEVEVEFDATGKLSNYRFIRSSRDARFDDSLKRALLSLEPLPTLRKYKATILFNLDDLQG